MNAPTSHQTQFYKHTSEVKLASEVFKTISVMIKGKTADYILAAYLLATLYLRISVEGSLQSHPILSVALGVVMLVLIWAVIKVKWLQPNYFGLLGDRDEKVA